MILKKSFQKNWSVFECLLQHHASPCLPEAHFEIHPQISDEHVREALNNHIRLYSLLGFQVTTQLSKEEMPAECICVLTVRRGGKLEYRRCLKIRVEYVAKKTVYVEKIFDYNKNKYEL